MNILGTSYLGLSLKNPLIVGSSSLSNSVDKVKRLEEAGAGAVVLKSLFEEQMLYDVQKLQQAGDDYPEASDYLQSYVLGHSVSEYLKHLKEVKKAVSIPVIASINCISAAGWIKYALEMEQAGADAIEVNVYFIPTDKETLPSQFEKVYFDIAEKLGKELRIPFAFKLGNHFTNLTYIVDQLYFRGAKGVVLFNRFYEPDIDLNNLTLKSASVFSQPSDLRYSLRWVSIISAAVDKIQIAASTGIHDADGVLKMLLAGASVTEICSALYKKGPDLLKTILQDLSAWMEKHQFGSIDEFRGKLNYRNIDNPQLYERSQFMKYFSNYE